MNYQSILLCILSILLSFPVTAQIKPMPDKMIGKIQENKTETNCKGLSKNIYDILVEGKPLLIIYDGWNCGNCKRIAPTVSDFMSKNHGVINFWSPLMKMGSPVTCRDLEQWEEWFPGFKYSFAFPVNNSYYHDYYGTSFNLPFIIVIDPKTRKVVYTGGQDNYKGHVEEAFKEASRIALSLIPVPVSNKVSGFKDTKVVFKELLTEHDSFFEYQNDY